MEHSTPTKRAVKARAKRSKKPSKAFPLFKHSTNRWCKKVKGKHRYFGSTISDPDGAAALALWLAQKDYLLNGIKPPTGDERATVALVCNSFLENTERLMLAGERSERTLADYLLVSQRMTLVLGRDRLVSELTPDDFARLRASFGRTRGAFALSGDIARVKAIFHWGTEKLEPPAPLPRWGGSIEKPNLRTLRLARAANGPRIFERRNLWALLYGATQPMRSMILLALNAGFGNGDVGRLPLDAVNLRTGWLDFPRPKTGIQRRVPLWEETADSLREWLDVRPKAWATENESLMFTTARGGSWFKAVDDNPVAKEFAKLAKRLGIQKRGLTFYSLRRTFRTVASESRDEAAADAIMGHAPNANDMAAIYRQRVDDDRLRAVVDHVHDWLFPRPTVG